MANGKPSVAERGDEKPPLPPPPPIDCAMMPFEFVALVVIEPVLVDVDGACRLPPPRACRRSETRTPRREPMRQRDREAAIAAAAADRLREDAVGAECPTVVMLPVLSATERVPAVAAGRRRRRRGEADAEPPVAEVTEPETLKPPLPPPPPTDCAEMPLEVSPS